MNFVRFHKFGGDIRDSIDDVKMVSLPRIGEVIRHEFDNFEMRYYEVKSVIHTIRAGHDQNPAWITAFVGIEPLEG